MYQATITPNRFMESARVALALSKPAVTLMLVFTALAAALAASRGTIAAADLILLALAGTLSCAGCAWVNQYLDQDIDAIMTRTRNRPLPRGRAPGVSVAAVGIALIATGVRVGAFINLSVALCVLVGALCYTVVYTYWLKRRSVWNIVVGGAAGSFAALAGWAVAEPGFSPVAWILAALLFLWTPPHFWSFAMVYAKDYERAGVPMLTARVGARASAWMILAHTLALVIASSALAASGIAQGWVYPVVAIAANVYLLRAAVKLIAQPQSVEAWKAYKASSMYLALILFGLVLGAGAG